MNSIRFHHYYSIHYKHPIFRGTYENRLVIYNIYCVHPANWRLQLSSIFSSRICISYIILIIICCIIVITQLGCRKQLLSAKEKMFHSLRLCCILITVWVCSIYILPNHAHHYIHINTWRYKNGIYMPWRKIPNEYKF